MPWQTTTETGRVARIAYAAEATAIPGTLPNTGSSLDWTQTVSGENVFGWTANDFKLTDEEITYDLVDEEGLPVKPPTLINKVALIRDSWGIDRIHIMAFEIGAKLFAWATNATETSGTFDETATFTRVALIIEVQGLGLRYFPSVEIGALPEKTGVRVIATQELVIDVFGTDSIPIGHQYKKYEDA